MFRKSLILFYFIAFSLILINSSLYSTAYNVYQIGLYNNIPTSSHLIYVNEDGEKCFVECDFILPLLPPDTIPSIDNPKYIPNKEADELVDEEFVMGVVINEVAYAFPYKILDVHEIVNTEIGGKKLAITLCPLTASGILFDRDSIGGSELGVSGKLYENNLVFYDRQTNQSWLQMYGQIIQGDEENLGKQILRLPIVETTWGAWKSLYPATLVLSRDTGIYDENQYSRSAYPGYDGREDTLFRSSFNEEESPYNLYTRKNRTLILEINNETRLYPYHELSTYSVINDEIDGQAVLIVYDEVNRLALPFSPVLENGIVLEGFSQDPLSEIRENSYQLPVFRDSSGSQWNFRGEAISGEYQGQKLQQIPAYTSYWFAASVMYPNATLFPSDSLITPVENSFDWASRAVDSSKAGDPSFVISAFSALTTITVINRIYRNKRKNII